MYIFSNIILGKSFLWDEEKNERLKKDRGISFEEIVETLAHEGPLWIEDHPSPEKYAGQKFFAVLISGYVHFVPFLETAEHIILKTVYPSRKATKLFNASRARNEKQEAP
jgi:uncharacterized DUF497 family protein